MTTAAKNAFSTSFVDVAGKKTQLTRGGSGPPLVYLHSAAGETDWLPIHAALAEHFCVYLPAHPGFALSTGLDEITDMADVVWHYVDLFDQLGLAQVPVVGFSLGGWIALELALLRPQAISRLVLVSSAGIRLDDYPMAEMFIDDLDELRRLLFRDSRSQAAESALPSSIDDPRVLLWLRAREATARVAWNPYLHNPRLAAHLHRITCPVRVIWGRHDRLIPVAHGEFLAERLPQAELLVQEDCGHMVPFEAPATVARLVRQFV